MQIKNIALALGLTMFIVACGGKDTPSPQPESVAKVVEPVLSAEQKLAQEQAEALEKEQEEAKKAAEEVVLVNQKLVEKHPSLAANILMTNKMQVGESVFYEVVLPQSVIYTDKEASFIFVGNMLTGADAEIINYTNRPVVLEAQQKFMQEQSMSSSNSQSLATNEETAGRDIFLNFPFHNGFNYTYGKPVNKILVFEDPDCAYCQKFHHDLTLWAEELNVEVAVFPYILESAHPNALNRARALMCAPDPAKAWKDWMTAAYAINKNGLADLDKLWSTWSVNNAPNATCSESSIVDMWQQVGKGLGLSATPTVIFENGLTAEGGPDKESFIKTLQFAKVDAERQDALKLSAPQSAPITTPAPSVAPQPVVPSNPAPPVNSQSNGDVTTLQQQMVDALNN